MKNAIWRVGKQPRRQFDWRTTAVRTQKHTLAVSKQRSCELRIQTMNRKTLLLILVTSVLLVTVVAVGVYFGTRNRDPELSEEASKRIDCYPEERFSAQEVTPEKCRSRGCLYEPISAPPDVYVPSCYMDAGRGYKVIAKDGTEKGDRYTLRPNFDLNQHYFSRVLFEVHYPSVDIVRFKFTDADRTRYEVPPGVVPINLPEVDVRRLGQTPRYTVNVSEDELFSFKVIRTETGTTLWDTSIGGLYLSDQFLTLSTILPSQNVYGFGENSHKRFRHDLTFRTWGMFARDEAVGTGHHNHYGVQPFYTCLEEDSLSHGVLLLNSNAMDYTMTPLPMLTYRTVGGVLDFYVFLGPTPEDVVRQYTGVTGRPYLPPYWSLGFQLCRYGYNSLHNLQAAVNRTLEADIPLDVQYADIDHYDERKVFTLDQEHYSGLPDYFDYLRQNGMHTVIILDPCFVSNETDYEPYDKARRIRGLIEWPNRSSITDPESVAHVSDGSLPMLGFVWPKGKVAFADFLNPSMADLWQELIVSHHNKVIHFDGLWIDMNEPANFGTNEIKPWNWPEADKPYWSLNCSTGSDLDHPDYRTMAVYSYDTKIRKAMLSDKTLCMIARQGANKQYVHYDVHNLYGHSQIKPTLRGLREATGNNKRGLVITRSTFIGSGRYAGHWLGDNRSTWKHMKQSIIGLLEYNLFGIPYVGADICGFFSEPDPELCKRWMQLGAFYPYARNHNAASSKVDQDPANFNDEVTELSRDALRTRYRLLPYLYTLFYLAHAQGNTVVRALFHEFTHDPVTWDIDEQFMWGSALMIVPILHNHNKLRYYLPKSTWYDYYTGLPVQYNDQSGQWHEKTVFSDSRIPLFVRGGHIIATQMYANNTRHSRRKPFDLWVYLDKENSSDGEARGQLYWDDGETIDTYETGRYYLAQYMCKNKRLRISVVKNDTPEMDSLSLNSVKVTAIDHAPEVVTLNGQSTDFIYSRPILTVSDLKLRMTSDVTLGWK